MKKRKKASVCSRIMTNLIWGIGNVLRTVAAVVVFPTATLYAVPKIKRIELEMRSLVLSEHVSDRRRAEEILMSRYHLNNRSYTIFKSFYTLFQNVGKSSIAEKLLFFTSLGVIFILGPAIVFELYSFPFYLQYPLCIFEAYVSFSAITFVIEQQLYRKEYFLNLLQQIPLFQNKQTMLILAIKSNDITKLPSVEMRRVSLPPFLRDVRHEGPEIEYITRIKNLCEDYIAPRGKVPELPKLILEYAFTKFLFNKYSNRLGFRTESTELVSATKIKN